jgi:hypothetical protein
MDRFVVIRDVLGRIILTAVRNCTWIVGLDHSERLAEKETGE